MLDDNFESHGNKDNAAEKLGACLIFIAEDAADFHADHAANKCRQTNKQHSGYDIHLKKGSLHFGRRADRARHLRRAVG